MVLEMLLKAFQLYALLLFFPNNKAVKAWEPGKCMEIPRKDRVTPTVNISLENQKDYGERYGGITFLSSSLSKVVLKCFAPFPVQWVFDNQQALGDTARNPYVANVRDFKELNDTLSYSYGSHMIFWYDSKVRTQYFSCEGIQNPCHRQLVVSKSLRNSRMTRIQLLDDLNVPGVGENQERGKGTRTYAQDVPAEEPCQAKFYHQQINSNWAFCCKSTKPSHSPGIVAAYGESNAMALENFERDNPEELPRYYQTSICTVSVQNLTDVCENPVELPTLKSHILFCEIEEEDRKDFFIKALFSISHPVNSLSKMYSHWYDLNPEDMIRLELSDPVQEFENNNLTIQCLFSLTYFSYGGFIAVQDSLDGLVLYINDNYGSSSDFDWGRATQGYFARDNAYRVNQTILLRKTTEALYCIAPVWNTTEWVNKSASVIVKDPKPLTVTLTQGEALKWDLGAESQALTCVVKGLPLTSVVWKFDKEEVLFNKTYDDSELENITESLRIPVVDKGTEGLYTCIVSNYAMTVEATIRVSVYDSKQQKIIKIISVIVVLVGLVLVLGLIYLWAKNVQQRRALRLLTPREIKHFTEGSPYVRDEDPLSFMQKPYNSEYEISRHYLIFDESNFLGKGEFGVIYKGELKISKHPSVYLPVAVKTIPKNVATVYFKALLSELKILSIISSEGHPNVVRLVGACTQNLEKREVYAAIEFCSNGNLKHYLESQRKIRDIMERNLSLRHEESLPGTEKLQHELTQFAIKIANGMEFLASKNVVHGDIAARNILLDDMFEPKIADFGLARLLAEPVYVKSIGSQCPLPWRWMAIESLESMSFSLKSDVWAYGVLLWEIFSMGQSPYSGLGCNVHFLQSLKKGMRCIKPTLASIAMYTLMCDCWKEEPSQRLAFPQIISKLEEIRGRGSLGEGPGCGTHYVKFHIQRDYVSPR